MEYARLQAKKRESDTEQSRSVRRAKSAGMSSSSLLFSSESHGMRLASRSHSAQLPLAGVLQTKSSVSQPTDSYEHEADRVAEQVMRMPDPAMRLQRKCACGASGGECECGKQQPLIQRKISPVNAPAATAAPPIVHDVLRSSGQPLDQSTRAFFEPRMGHDLSHVRVHTDDRAAASAQSVNALAYTVGHNIAFGRGQYAPQTGAGRQLLAHELVHTIQQGATGLQSSARGTIQRQGGARVPRRTIWVNIGFDSSARANEETMRRLRASIAVEKAAIASCCSVHSLACNIDVKTRYDWDRRNKPAPRDGDYDADDAADRALVDRNLGNIAGHAGGRNVLVTESTLSQTWQGVRIFPRANTGASGILWNRALAADDTLAHESGHGAGYVGDAEGGAHSSDPHNLMSPGSVRAADATPDRNWCQQMAATAV